MRVIKGILIFGAVLIVAGFAFIGWEVYQRATNPDHPRAFARDRTPAPDRVDATVAQSKLTPGSRIGTLLVLNSRLVYHVILPDGSEQIHLLDPRTGVSQIVVSAPASPGAEAAAPARP